MSAARPRMAGHMTVPLLHARPRRYMVGGDSSADSDVGRISWAARKPEPECDYALVENQHALR